MAEEHLLLFNREPTRRQFRIVLLAGGILLLVALVSYVFRLRAMPALHAFIPVVDTTLLLGDALTATLFFAQASVLRSRALVALGTGYLFTGLIIIPHALTFPGAFAPDGLLGAGLNTAIWIYLFWHCGIPIAAMASKSLRKSEEAGPIPHESVNSLIAACAMGAVVLTIALTALAIAGDRLLPGLMLDPINLESRHFFLAGAPFFILLAVAMVTLLRGRRTILDLWLALSFWAWLIDLALFASSSMRFSAGFYMGRISGFLAALLVLMMLLAESNKLYARLALSLMEQRRERETKLMTVSAVSASIAHEMKQPLASMVANAGAALARLNRIVPDLNELPDILKSIVKEGRDAADVVESVRTMFGKGKREQLPLEMAALIRETAAMIAGELAAHRISLQFEASDNLPLAIADRLQIQHVLLNLFVNAIEAMTPAPDRPHSLLVQAAAHGSREILVVVEDSGVGIDPENTERIFQAFFSTKTQGTGMGLALCRSIVEAHGGRLWAETRAPYGARFQMLLPCALRAHAQSS